MDPDDGMDLDQPPPKKKLKSLKKTEARSLDDFSTEVIILILKNIKSIYDRINFSMTCNTIYEIFNDLPIYHKDKVIKVTARNQQSFLRQFVDQRGRNHPTLTEQIFPNIVFEGCTIDDFNRGWMNIFWQKYGPKVLSISFHYCVHGTDHGALKRIIDSCPILEELIVTNNGPQQNLKYALNECSELKYETLKKLILQVDSRTLTNYSVCNFLWNTPDDCYRDITFPRMTFDRVPAIADIDNAMRAVNAIAAANPSTPSNAPVPPSKPEPPTPPKHRTENQEELTYKYSMFILPLNKIKIWRQTEFSLKEIRDIINLKDFGFTLENFTMAIKAIPSQVREVNQIPLLRDMFNHITRTYADTLTHFDISLCPKNIHQIERTGIQRLKNLKTLKLPDNISARCFVEIIELKKIENLYLGVDKFTIIAIRTAMIDVLLELPNLRKLVITGADLKDFDRFFNYSACKLIELELIDCKVHSIHKFFLSLFENQRMIEKLDLLFNGEVIKDSHLGYHHILYEVLFNQKPETINCLKNLKSLNLRNVQLTDGILNEFKWDGLNELGLFSRKNQTVTDDALLSLSINCPALVKVNLTGFNSITDEGIKHLCNLSRLKYLTIRHASLTRNSATHLSLSSCPLTVVEGDIREFRVDGLYDCLFKKMSRSV